MNEDPTKKFSDGESFEARVLFELSAIRAEQAETRKDIAALDSRLGAVEERLTSVEERLTSVEERLTSVEERLTSVEDRVDARLRETRPIWEAVLEDIKRLDAKFDEVLRDLFEARADVRIHEKRLLQLENAR